MLLIRAVSFNGRPVGRDLVARLGQAGGTIGRGENSTLVLPDTERFISRIHASISFQAGGFVITDKSTKNPVVLNGRSMGPGGQSRLGDGDQIQIGGYLLAVELVTPSAPEAPPAEVGAARGSGLPNADPWLLQGPLANAPDPFADLLKPRTPAPPPPPSSPLSHDPLADWQGRAAGTPDPFADLLKPRTPGPPPPANPAAAQSARPDPLADLRRREPSIDDVLDLKQSGVPDLLGPGPRPTGSVEGIGIVDPLEALGGARKPTPPPTVPDHGQELFTPYAPPAAKPDPAEPPRAGGIPLLPPPIAQDIFTRGAPPGAPPDPVRQPRAEPVGPLTPPIVPPAPVQPPPQPVRAVAGAEDLTQLQALLRGAGIQDSPLLKTLTPETMESIGKLLREAVQGTLDLLRARGLMKGEMRADVTMIMPVDNNPLKFSPTAEAAMMHLLAPHVQGFMPPVRAMKNAYEDLRAHELGVLAGMRAALDEVLARFAPGELTKRLSDPSVLDNLLPANRKARQWDLFVERYEAVAEEAREDFHAAFGKAFRRAYEAQVKQIRAEERRGS